MSDDGRGLQINGQLLAQGQASAMQASLDDIESESEDLRRFFGGEFLQVAQQDDGAIGLRQFVDGGVECITQFVAQDFMIRLIGAITYLNGSGCKLLIE